MPNTFAYLVLYSSPLVVVLLYRLLPKAQALVVSILGGYLLLPYAVGFNPPILPPLDKTLLPALSAAVMSILLADRAAPRAFRPARRPHLPPSGALPGKRPPYTRQSALADSPEEAATTAPAHDVQRPGRNDPIGTALLILLFVSPFLTVLANTAPYISGPRVLKPLGLHDALSMAVQLLIMVLPFLLARRYLTTPRHHTMLLRGLCISGLLYSLPTLFEVRMSPQIARWVYGFLAQSFLQAMRDGGFRPVVFLEHGLWLAIFIAMTALAGAALWRETRAHRLPGPGRWLLASVWLLGTLILCHSLGALLEALLVLPVILFLPVRAQLIIAAAIAGIIVTYPALRGSGLVPTSQLVQMADAISANRAQSLEFRLENEDLLLHHAQAKPFVGWGGWGRSRIYDAYTGKDISVTDGEWIITVGMYGWIGYIARFGLLAAPILLLALRSRRLRPTPATAGLCLVLVANMIDLIPNATLTPVTWLIAGALMGRLRQAGTDTAEADVPGTGLRHRAMRRPQATASVRGPGAAARGTGRGAPPA